MTPEDAPPPSAVPRSFTDGGGRLWSTSWTTWATPTQVRRLMSRQREVLIRSAAGDVLLDGVRAQEWWQHAQHHLVVPGRATAVPDAEGLTWAAHVYRCDDGRAPDRRLVIETIC